MGAMTPPPHALGNPWVPSMVPIAHVQRELADVVTLTLPAPDAEAGFPFAPGQFNMLYAFGIGEVPISISGDPERPDKLVHTIRGVGAVTRAMAGLRAGDRIGVRGPYGSPWPVDAAVGRDVLVIAGGLGLAPLRPAIYHLLNHRDLYGRITILVGAKGLSDLLFRHEIEGWSARLDLDVEVALTHPGPAWHGHVGLVTVLLKQADFEPANAVAWICGPEVMMRATARELTRQGVPDERLFVSLERNMHCAVGLCGHCQLGPTFVCKDGPVFSFHRAARLMSVRGL